MHQFNDSPTLQIAKITFITRMKKDIVKALIISLIPACLYELRCKLVKQDSKKISAMPTRTEVRDSVAKYPFKLLLSSSVDKIVDKIKATENPPITITVLKCLLI